ncbi:MarR family winged helix-turn-helix transcriptional regulator [Sphingomonas sp. S2-65]|uniref:MarR family winged helix-turn-helix transcriptional regulator n=1 Tax=Sphingomonas sp. S2-65 TaxID=2903960 RepID=UPI001F2068DD|nr:MarR family transcriptional regulator [Sphingomonas sp. S2-65]UYY59259.1 MarR family transcriptional regulator [Sphingomonas sp. S2-65]UYY59272.1 MarR family transcriptional regulator [Sphingomonas sp. S2-65]
MTKPTDDQIAALGAVFDTFTRRYKLVDAAGAGKSLNELDKQTLLYVADQPGCGPSDVARFLGVANTTITSATDRLVKRGLLARRRAEGDRRAVALALSAEGEACVVDIRAAHRQLYDRMLEPLSTAERDSLIGMLQKIASNDD